MAKPRLYSDLSWIWTYLSPADHYVEEVETFVKRFREKGVPDGGSVLHLGSGGGSIDFHLKRLYRVTGLDRSPDMIRVASSVNPEVEYVEGDIRAARLGRTFDAVLSHDAIAYMLTQDDLDAAYRTAAAHLKPGGVMVALPEQVQSFFVQNKVEHRFEERDGKSVTTIHVAFDPDPNDETCETTFVYLIWENGKLTVETDTHLMGLHPLESFLGAMRRAGFDPRVDAWELSDAEDGCQLVTAVLR